MIKLMKSSFYNETKTKKKLAVFLSKAKILSMSNECRLFEINFAKKQNRKFACFVGSGSMANLILFQAMSNLGWLESGACVGFSTLTWATNVMPLIQLGFKPLPLDCSLKSLNVTPAEVEKNKHMLKALFLTNVLGFCDDIEKI